MMSSIDRFLNSITMYRLLVYGLGILFLISVGASFIGVLPYTVLGLIGSAFILVVVSQFSNLFLQKIFGAQANIESAAITGLILFFILPPLATLYDAGILAFAAILAMTSKYVLALGRKHIFNPAAVAAVILGLMGLSGASWWVASSVLLPFTLVFGLLIVHKIRRYELFVTFLIASIVSILGFGIYSGADIALLAPQIFTSWPVIFFGTVMLTEPFTTPPSKGLQIGYGLITGLLFGIPFRYGPFFATPELILVIGNIYSYIVSPKYRILPEFLHKSEIAHSIYEFVFRKPKNFTFQPGQYMEWTLEHESSDDRGNRRYFTLASSPTEDTVRLAVKMPEQPSSFKKALINLKPQDHISLSGLAGDFVLPKKHNGGMVFIAGGIGITPFRSMIQYLVDRQEKRDITLFYATSHADEFAYDSLWQKASDVMNFKYVKVLSGKADVPDGWDGHVGYLDANIIKSEVDEPMNCMYYLSGPNAMVTAYKKMLLDMGIKGNMIITDYFPGY